MNKLTIILLLFVGIITGCVEGNNKNFIGKWNMEGGRPQNINAYSFLKKDGSYVVLNNGVKLTEGKWTYLSPDQVRIDLWLVGDKTQEVKASISAVIDGGVLIMTRDGVSKKFNRVE